MCWLSRLLKRRRAYPATVGERVFVLGVLATSSMIVRPPVAAAPRVPRKPALAVSGAPVKSLGLALRPRRDPFATLTRESGV